MPPIISAKHRGKSAAPPTSGLLLSASQSTITAASPLKIESVLPTLGGRGATTCSSVTTKSMYRSYSTLSSGYFKKPASGDTRADLQRKLQNAQPSPCGFWRIQRTAKEKEKLPDRINLDRRGLTALPIIDDEPNLRLLSLQHNLINCFSVPEPSPTGGAAAVVQVQVAGGGGVGLTTDVKKTTLGGNAVAPRSGGKRQQFLMQRASARNLVANSGTFAGCVGMAKPQNAGVKNSFVQKSALLHAKERYVFRKSSSFINGYSQHLAASKIQLGRPMDASPKTAAAPAAVNMTSFSTDSGISDVDSSSHKPLSSASSGAAAKNNSIIQKPNVPPIPPTALQPPLATNPLDILVIRNESHTIANNLQNLVFIDLYDNQIEKISSLDGLKSLTVLLLGKNRITDISGLACVKQTLRVLDLHGNKLTAISHKICQLQELKSLNLAGNSLRLIHADDFKGMLNLRELNLKRNRIKRIAGFEDMRSLERLWLCHNDLQKVDDMAAIAKAIHLKEVTVEHNPVSLGGDCVSFLVSYLPCLQLLSQMQVTEQVRRAAHAWRKSKETTDETYSHLSSDVCQSVRREEIISNARTNWELMRTQPTFTNKSLSSSAFIQRSIRNNTAQHPAPSNVSDVEPDTMSDMSDASRRADRKAIALARQKTLSNRVRAMKKSACGAAIGRQHHRRSMSQENLVANGVTIVESSSSPATSPSESEFFRLPPILAPFLSTTEQQSATTAAKKSDSPNPSTAGSSLGPNVDSSSSSCVSSDNEDCGVEDGGEQMLPLEKELTVDEKNDLLATELVNNIQNVIAKEPNTVANPPELTVESIPSTSSSEPTISHQSNNPDRSNSPNKTTNMPLPSADKTANQPSEPPLDISKSSAKTRSALPPRRFPSSPLVRAQTAKNISLNVPSGSSSSKHHTANSAAAAASAVAASKPVQPTLNEREREQGGDYLIEICGRYLNVYGAGAIKFIDRQWNAQKAADVHTLKFSYVNFNSIATILSKIKVRFPNAENFVFRETNINCLGQLNALAEVQGIHSLVIDPEGNLVCTKSMWRLYAVYRLSHWGVKVINGDEVTDSERDEAQRTYAGLSDLVLWSLPDALLEPLLARLRLDETCSASKMSAKQWLMQADESLRNVVGKEALQCKRSTGGGGMSVVATAATNTNHQVMVQTDEMRMRDRGRVYFEQLMANTCNAVEKLQKLETLWPNFLVEIIRNTLLDYAQLDVYVKNLMVELAASGSSSKTSTNMSMNNMVLAKPPPH